MKANRYALGSTCLAAGHRGGLVMDAGVELQKDWHPDEFDAELADLEPNEHPLGLPDGVFAPGFVGSGAWVIVRRSFARGTDVIGFFETDKVTFEYAERWFPEGSWSIVEQIDPVTYRSQVLGDRSLFDPVLDEERGRLESGDDLDGPWTTTSTPLGHTNRPSPLRPVGRAPLEATMTRPDAGPYPQYIIYDRPRDFPDHFVVREWVAQGATPLPTGRVSVHPTLKDAQDAMPETYAPVSRAPEDDPVIVEVWVPEHWAETLQMVVNLGEEEAIRRLKVFSKAIPIVPTTIIRRKSDK